MFFYVLAVLGAAALLSIILFMAKKIRHRNLVDSFGLVLFQIKIPREKPSERGERGDLKAEIQKTEQLLSGLASIGKPIVFEVAVRHIGEEIHFFAAVPRRNAETLRKQVQGIWTHASVEEVLDDYNIFNPHGANSGAYVTLKENHALPIRTYADVGADTFSSILAGFTRVAEVGEGAALQIVCSPVESAVPKSITSKITVLKKGETLKRALAGPSILESEKPTSKKDAPSEPKVIDEGAVRALEAKVAKPLFRVNVRLVSSAGSPFQADDIIQGLAAGFGQLESPSRNGFKVTKVKNPKDMVYDFIFRRFDDSKAMVLNSEEVASFFHFPISLTDTPKVEWLKTKEAPPPADLPSGGTLLGRSSYRGDSKPIYITDEDRRRHIYVVGQTGTGKTTAIASMLIEDIKKGKGVAIIDPHGEFAEKAMGHVPRERMDDVIYFDPADTARPLGLNLLEYDINRPEEKTFIVNEFLGIFDKLYDLKQTGGPVFETYMRNALQLLLEDMPNEPATLMEVPRVFTDPEFRRRKLERIMNPIVIDFWEREAVKAGGELSLANVTPYVTSKFNTFIGNDYMRPIIGQPKSSFNFREVMDGGKILLINLSKGRIGDINASLLGMVFTGKILMAALSRSDTEESRRRDFHLYIDEFHNFATDSIATILSEARKYRLSLTMAHQFIAQLKENIRDAVFGNVGTQMVMRVGPQDAEFLAKQFAPVFDESDLMGLDNLAAYVRLLINGQTSRPFNIMVSTASWDPGDQGLAHNLKEYSRLKYGMERRTVEEGIYARLRG